MQPVRKRLVRKLELAATVEALKKVDLSARVPGEVKFLDDKMDIGRPVKENEVLLRLDVPDLDADLALKKATVGQAIEQEKLANAEESRAASTDNKKQMVGGERVRQTAAFAVNEASPIKRIEAGGKRFDLTDGVWTDSAILPEDPAPALLNVKSTDFERLRKEFTPYLALISRPEDVLIKLDNQVFRIKKAR